MSINLDNFKGFILEPHDNSPEANKLIYYCIINDFKFIKSKEYDKNYIPLGSIEFIENILGFSPVPNYYPDWLKHKLYRNVFQSNEWILGKKYFVKPADKHKRFNGFITKGTYSKKKKPPFWYSDIIHFENEFRYYILNGKNLGGFWYNGINTEQELIVPNLDFKIPETFTGTIDMGLVKNELVLVECHPPYSCGWYGTYENFEIYLKWIINGWKYLLNTYNIK